MVKFRYVFKHRKDGDIQTEIYDLDQIQDGRAKGMIRAFQSDGYHLISRDRWTGLTDRNNQEVYQRDLVKSYHNNQIEEIRCGLYWEDDDCGEVYANGFYFYKGNARNGIDKGCPFALDCFGSTEKYEKVGTIYDQDQPAK